MLLACLVTGAHAGEPWSTEDATRQTAYTVLHLADWAQTLEGRRSDPYWKENNPILGEHPSRSRINNYFALTLIGHWAITDQLAPRWRPWWQYVWIAVECGAVTKNYKAGIRISF